MKYPLIVTAFVLLACSNSEGPDQPLQPGSDAVIQGTVEYRASTAVMESFPVQVRTEVTLRNQRGEDITVTFSDGCVVQVEVYRDSARRDLVWDSASRFGCSMALVPVSIGAGKSTTVSAPSISAADILGSSLPNGRYYFTAVIRPDGTTLNLDAGSVELGR
jgi:hypothetical protein